MKKQIMFLMLFAVVSFAQNGITPEGDLTSADSLNIFQTDSAKSFISITKIVIDQFNSAKTGSVNSSINYQPPAIQIETIIEKPQGESLWGKAFLYGQGLIKKSLNIIIFIIASAFVIVIIFGRRLFKKYAAKSRSGLKKSIAIIRAEMPVLITNKKLLLLRKKLSDSPDILNVSESAVSRKAKDLNLGKGELMLAAKIKSFQFSHGSRQEFL